MTNEEKARQVAVVWRAYGFPYETIYKIVLKSMQWKDEQHEHSLIDLNCKLEEQQENYEELKKRYDEAVEREKIATKIINELRARK